MNGLPDRVDPQWNPAFLVMMVGVPWQWPSGVLYDLARINRRRFREWLHQ